MDIFDDSKSDFSVKMRQCHDKVRFNEKYVRTIRMIDRRVKRDRYERVEEERDGRLPEIELKREMVTID